MLLPFQDGRAAHKTGVVTCRSRRPSKLRRRRFWKKTDAFDFRPSSLNMQIHVPVLRRNVLNVITDLFKDRRTDFIPYCGYKLVQRPRNYCLSCRDALAADADWDILSFKCAFVFLISFCLVFQQDLEISLLLCVVTILEFIREWYWQSIETLLIT